VNPVASFHSDQYLRHNARRLEHLASLRIPVAGLSVLEVGAGIGDHSHYYIDRGCRVTITEAREENLDLLKKRFPNENVLFLDMESPSSIEGAPFDITHCYGLLYHLSNPEQALSFLSQNTKRMLFLETCVSFGDGEEVNPTLESQDDPTQAFSGTGCRPTRAWVFGELRKQFAFVYVPTTQPWHEEFPIDWDNGKEHRAPLQRAIFIASRDRIENTLLANCLVSRQRRSG
jgi:SAM-dependent methyltransferase